MVRVSYTEHVTPVWVNLGPSHYRAVIYDSFQDFEHTVFEAQRIEGLPGVEGGDGTDWRLLVWEHMARSGSSESWHHSFDEVRRFADWHLNFWLADKEGVA